MLHLPGSDEFGEIIAWVDGLFSRIDDTGGANGSQWHWRGSAKEVACDPCGRSRFGQSSQPWSEGATAGLGAARAAWYKV